MQVYGIEASPAGGFSIGIQQQTNGVINVIPSPIRHIVSHNRSLDRTEFDGHLTTSNVTHLPPIPGGTPALFRGVLSLYAIAHLSSDGQNYLNPAFRELVTRSAMNGVL